MSDDQADTFEKLISDMRHEEPDVPNFEPVRGAVIEMMDGYARRLEVLLAGMEPFLMPVYGKSAYADRIDWEDGDPPPPILADLLGDERPPGSDWVLIDPVKEDDLTEVARRLGATPHDANIPQGPAEQDVTGDG